MINKFLDIEKYSSFILTGLIAIILIGCLNTPVLLHLELENIFNSFLINEATHNIISTNMQATANPPLFYWIKHIVINIFGFNLTILKLIPALAMACILALSYLFINKQTNSKNFAISLAIILATSPFYITASKLVSLDLIYILLYISTTFIFTANVYTNNYSNMSNFIAGILLAAAFSLTGFIGAAPILINLILINFIRGGFFINLKFNNPIVIAAGFVCFIAIWVGSLSKDLGFTQALDLIFNYQFINKIADFSFDEKIFNKYTVLFIIGGFPWISLLPSAIWSVIKTLPRRMNTSDLQTSLPLICLINAIMLTIYFATVEQEFYILLTIFFSFAILIADRINNIEIQPASILNIVFVLYSIAIMMIFLNEFIDIELIQYSFDNSLKELLISEKTSISAISDSSLIILAVSYCISALSLFGYALSRNRTLFNITLITAVINLFIFVFAIFPNLKNSELNNSRSTTSWLSISLKQEPNSMLFYKVKEPTIASKAKTALYFDDLVKLQEYTKEKAPIGSYIAFNKADRRLVARLNKSSALKCRNNICITRLK